MGEENANHRTSLDLLHSDDSFNWKLLPERT